MQVGGYELLSELGRGGMGVVHRARAADGRFVALKALRAGADADALASFERERRLVFSFGEADGFVPVLDASSSPPFIVMPLVEGGTLRDRLRARPLAVADAVALTIQLAKALGRAHERGVVHRDLKPENVLFTKDGRPLVADLGLAKHFRRDVLGASRSASLSATGTIVGTPGYMAREQLEDAKGVGPPTDVFALGVILHEALARTRPFGGTTLLEYADALARRSPKPLRGLRADVPAWLERVVLRALDGDPRARFADGHAFARALEQGSTARPLPVRAALVAAGLVALVAAAALLVASKGPPPSSPSPSPVPRPPRPKVADEALREEEIGDASVRQGQLEPAIRHYTRAIDLEPRRASAYCKRAMVHNFESQFDLAVADASRAIELEPNDAEGYAERAYSRATTSMEAATRDVDRALALDRENAMARLVGALLGMAHGRFAEAEPELDFVIARQPMNPLAFLNRAVVREKSGALEGALEDVERVIRLAPDITAAHGRRAIYLEELGRLEEADEAARVYLERYPQGPMVNEVRQIRLRVRQPGRR